MRPFINFAKFTTLITEPAVLREKLNDSIDAVVGTAVSYKENEKYARAFSASRIPNCDVRKRNSMKETQPSKAFTLE